ncbi:hypothetical protein [Streptomyces sp. NPDC093094]|uniref:hypothetical protein n=1 Tax=Streptomyces sp. NPDC093094 TaxID=3366026 RepID=UPI0038135816
MSSLLRDLESSTARIVGALRHSGCTVDHSMDSLAETDRFIDDRSSRGVARPAGLLADGLGQKLFALGGCVGEVVRRQYGGTWQVDDDGPRGETDVEVRLPEGGVVRPVRRVMRRFRNGPEDSISVYGTMIGRTGR